MTRCTMRADSPCPSRRPSPAVPASTPIPKVGPAARTAATTPRQARSRARSPGSPGRRSGPSTSGCRSRGPLSPRPASRRMRIGGGGAGEAADGIEIATALRHRSPRRDSARNNPGTSSSRECLDPTDPSRSVRRHQRPGKARRKQPPRPVPGPGGVGVVDRAALQASGAALRPQQQTTRRSSRSVRSNAPAPNVRLYAKARPRRRVTGEAKASAANAGASGAAVRAATVPEDRLLRPLRTEWRRRFSPPAGG
jgi:hypothetical protein